MFKLPLLPKKSPTVETKPSADPPDKKRSLPWSRVWFTVGIVGGVALSAYGVREVYGRFDALLDQDVEEVLYYARPSTITIKAADGSYLKRIGPVPQAQLSLDEVSPVLVQAFLASEDARFYDHPGVDIKGITRATYNNLTNKDVVEGGSTITQQLARIVFLNQERTFERKLKELRLALEIDRQLTKQEILEKYLNLVYLGSGAYGVADAAWIYFSKTAAELTIPEAAMIAGITPAPSRYSPFVDLELATQRRNLVIERMVDQGFITPEAGQEAIASELVTQRSAPQRFEVNHPYFTTFIEQELDQYLTPEQLEQGGLTVETTLDPQWQTLAQQTIIDAVEQYGPGQRFTQGALVSIDPRTGEVKALVGGKDFADNQYNRATQAQRQPGSTFKPFVYATAIATGMSPYQTYPDSPYTVDGYTPENYGDRYSNRNVSLYAALRSSLNVVAVRTLVEVGWNPIIKLAQDMGIKSELKPTYSLALGASEVNVLEITGAYGVLANNGEKIQVHGIKRILDREGNEIYNANGLKATTALDAESAAIMTWMLQAVVSGGTGSNANIGRPVAGKTGTSDQSRDLWFIGYIPQIVTGVWLGNDDNSPTWGSSSTAALIWRNFMKEATADLPVESFPPRPSNLSNRKGTIEREGIKPSSTKYKKPATDSGSRPATPAPSAPAAPPPADSRRPKPVITPELEPKSVPTPVTPPTLDLPIEPAAPTRPTAPPQPLKEPVNIEVIPAKPDSVSTQPAPTAPSTPSQPVVPSNTPATPPVTEYEQPPAPPAQKK